MDLLALKWWGNDPKLCARVDAVASSWLGTKYMEGQRAKGMSCDCREFIQGFLDEMYRNPVPTVLPRIMSDAAVHTPALAAPAIRAMTLSNHGVDDVTSTAKTLEPGDILACSGEIRGVGAIGSQAHGAVVGGEPWSLYHALPQIGVVRSSIAGAGTNVVRLYRPRKKHLWA